MGQIVFKAHLSQNAVGPFFCLKLMLPLIGIFYLKHVLLVDTPIGRKLLLYFNFHFMSLPYHKESLSWDRACVAAQHSG